MKFLKGPLLIPVIVGVIALGAILAVGAWATDFTVYLGNDPTACNNCHVMDAVYEGWYHAGHQRSTTCVDCHTPHPIVLKYLYKAKSGMNHVFMFSTGQIPEPLRAKEETDQIIQENCIRCHSETVSEIGDGQMDSGRYCFECHRGVAHGPRGISILPYQDKGMYTPLNFSSTEK
jgi:cytochrome c nitrite reductase small subunit